MPEGMHMSTLNSSFAKADALVSITLHKSPLSKEGENYGKVTRNTVTLENMIAAIKEENRGLDPFMVQHSAILLQQQIIKMLQQGNSVNVLDLGFLYPALKGTVKGDKPGNADLPDFTVRFTPSSLVTDCISNLAVDKIVLSDSSPQINTITDEWTKQQNASLTKNKTCYIEGKRLNLGTTPNSIIFIMVDDDGNEVDGQEQIAVPPEMIITNTATKLRFYVPEGLTASAMYKIKLSTTYISKTQNRKTPVSTESTPVFIN